MLINFLAIFELLAEYRNTPPPPLIFLLIKLKNHHETALIGAKIYMLMLFHTFMMLKAIKIIIFGKKMSA